MNMKLRWQSPQREPLTIPGGAEGSPCPAQAARGAADSEHAVHRSATRHPLARLGPIALLAGLLGVLLACDSPRTDPSGTTGGDSGDDSTPSNSDGPTADIPPEQSCECVARCEEFDANGQPMAMEQIIVTFELLDGLCEPDERADHEVGSACWDRANARWGGHGVIYNPIGDDGPRMTCKKTP